ncbi:E3 ubiquitin-protein ligase MARCH2, partial [Mucuna pruriens]
MPIDAPPAVRHVSIGGRVLTRTMEEHVLSVDPFVMAPATLQSQHGGDARGSHIEGATHVNDVAKCDALEEDDEEEEDLVQMVECRICQEEETLQNLDIPCACSGTLKFAHTSCVQLWCFEKGDTICEICHQKNLLDLQPFKPGYTATSPVYHPGDTSIDISDDWAISSNPLDLHDTQLLAIAAVEHQVLETEHEYYVYTGTGGITLWHSVGLILMALLLLRHSTPLFNADVEKVLSYVYLFFLWTAAVILPCYLMSRIICIIQHQRQRQQTAEGLAFMLQAEEQQVFHNS